MFVVVAENYFDRSIDRMDDLQALESLTNDRWTVGKKRQKYR